MSQFYPVPETNIDLRYIDTNLKTMTVKPFQISALITVKRDSTGCIPIADKLKFIIRGT